MRHKLSQRPFQALILMPTSGMVRDELRGFSQALSLTRPGPTRRPAAQRVLVRACGPGHHGESASRVYLRVPDSFRSIADSERYVTSGSLGPSVAEQPLRSAASPPRDWPPCRHRKSVSAGRSTDLITVTVTFVSTS